MTFIAEIPQRGEPDRAAVIPSWPGRPHFTYLTVLHPNLAFGSPDRQTSTFDNKRGKGEQIINDHHLASHSSSRSFVFLGLLAAEESAAALFYTHGEVVDKKMLTSRKKAGLPQMVRPGGACTPVGDCAQQFARTSSFVRSEKRRGRCRRSPTAFLDACELPLWLHPQRSTCVHTHATPAATSRRLGAPVICRRRARRAG
jgi:hypothetical protein